MSGEILAILAVGVALAGVILTSNRGGGNPAREKTMKYAVLFVFFSAVIAVGQDRAEPGHQKNIVGGEDAGTDEFPFVAKIIYGGSQVGCTGTLIGPDKVLTAGHCVDRYRLTRLSVGFGDTRTVEPRYSVARKILHPEYSTQENDIAILQLESAVAIQPVRILTLEEELQYAPSGTTSGVAVGWGYTEQAGRSGEPPETLQKITDIPIYTEEDCRRALADLRSQGKKPQPPSIHERVLCAGEEGRATGKGDSGGPLLIQTPEGWAQVGVLSQGTRDPSPQTVVYMGQYTRTSYFLDWVFPTYRLHFAHSATGGGWTTDLVLLNPLQEGVEATVEVFDSGGASRTEEQFSLRELSVVEWTLPEGEAVETGGVVVSSSEELSGFLRFRYSDGSATSVQSAPVGSAFMVPVSNQVDRVGLAVFNADDKDLTVVLRMGDGAVYKDIPRQGKIAGFVDEYFPNLGDPAGTLVVETDPPGDRINVLALELINGNLVTLPAVALGEAN